MRAVGCSTSRGRLRQSERRPFRLCTSFDWAGSREGSIDTYMAPVGFGDWKVADGPENSDDLGAHMSKAQPSTPSVTANEHEDVGEAAEASVAPADLTFDHTWTWLIPDPLGIAVVIEASSDSDGETLRLAEAGWSLEYAT